MQSLINGVDYRLDVYRPPQAVACALPSSRVMPSPIAPNELLASGSWSDTTAITAGNCRAYIGVIVRVSDGVEVSTAYATARNI